MSSNVKDPKYISVLLTDGESFFSIPTLQCLGSVKNVKVSVLANDPWATIRFSRYTHEFFSFPKETGSEGRLAAIMDIVKKRNIDLVLPIDQPTIRFLTERGEELSKIAKIAALPGAESFDISCNKWLLAEWLKNNNLPVPSTLLYQSGSGFRESLSNFVFPVLIKPIKGDGGIGIKYFDDQDSLINYCKDHIPSEEYIIQSFIMGYDIDCSVLCKDGAILASTIQKRIIKSPFYFGQTMNIDFLNDSHVFDVIREIIQKLNWSGVVHFDLRYDEKENQVKVIEMNPRFWGSIVGSYFAGVNFPYLATLLGLKRELPAINYVPIRYVDASTALKITFMRILHRKSTIAYYDHSKLEYHLKDPFPVIISGFIHFYKTIKRAIKLAKIKQRYLIQA